MKNITSLLIVLFVFLSCKNPSESNVFVSNIKDIKGELINVDCLIGRPVDLVCNDTRLLIYDPYEKKALTILDTKNNTCITRELSIGAGPGEVSGPLRISTSKMGKQLNVFQIQSGIFSTYNFSDDKLTLIESVRINNRPANVVATDDALVGIGPFENGRYQIYNKQGDLAQEVGAYPFDGENMDPQRRFFLYQGYLCSQPDGKHFALGSCYSDNLEFYSVEGNEVKLLRRYETEGVKATFENTIKLDNSCLLAYKEKYSTEKYCYMLYSGKTYEENMFRKMWATHIFVFDWNGNFVKSFRLDNEVISFCVDESNNTIYGIVLHDGEAAIMKFNM